VDFLVVRQATTVEAKPGRVNEAKCKAAIAGAVQIFSSMAVRRWCDFHLLASTLFATYTTIHL
jgi:hypothetical protein